MAPDRFEGGPRRSRPSAGMDQGTGLFGTTPTRHPKPEDDLVLLIDGQIQAHLDRAAGIQGGAQVSGQSGPRHRGGGGKGPIAPKKLCTVASQAPLRVIHIEKGNAPGELGVVGMRANRAPLPASNSVTR